MLALVCGGRHYDNWPVLEGTLLLMAPTSVVCGGASGADALAIRWARENGVECFVHPAHWELGARAGPLRNREMLEQRSPEVVVAFEGGAGTRDMIAAAEAAGVRVVRVEVARA